MAKTKKGGSKPAAKTAHKGGGKKHRGRALPAHKAAALKKTGHATETAAKKHGWAWHEGRKEYYKVAKRGAAKKTGVKKASKAAAKHPAKKAAKKGGVKKAAKKGGKKGGKKAAKKKAA